MTTTDNYNTTVNLTDDHHEENATHAYPTAIFFIFFSCALGALVRTLLKKVRLPYTVMVLVLGVLVGIVSKYVPDVKAYTTLSDIDPHTILHVFLPILIFESAFAMEAHTFLRSFVQIIVLSIPGLILAAFMTAVFSMHVFNYNWNWYVSMMFGAVISATDPVAVVALLKELGASKTLSTLIEGESLLNDGAAIVVFNVFLRLSEPGSSMAIGDIVLYFFRVALGGPVVGFIIAKLTTFWLVNIFNDAVTEITITLASTYLTFYVVELWLGMSGVLAVVVLGVTLSAERTSISPEVEAFLHRFWEMLAYLANTLIFMLVGVVISEKAMDNVTGNDWILLIALFCAINVIRGSIIALFSPLLKRIGYGLTWRNGTVMTWGGLRGAVGLALALNVARNTAIDPTLNTQNKILFHTAGIVMLTLVINATTMAHLLKILGMSEISVPKRMAMASAVRTLKTVVTSNVTMYKSDRFLADADWDIVQRYVNVDDPYRTLEEEAEMDELTSFERTSKCPVCEVDVPNEPSPKEWSEMKQEARLRLLKAKKTSYWKQFEHGMLSREAVRRLVECVDHVSDEAEGFGSTDEITKSWEIRRYLAYIKRKLEHWHTSKQSSEGVDIPTQKVRRWAVLICMHQAFEIILNIIIFTNVGTIIGELVAETMFCGDVYYNIYGNTYEIINDFYIALYTVEAIIKLVAYGANYFRSRWNAFDFIILVLSIGDMVLDLTVFHGAKDCDDAAAMGIVNPNFFKIAKAIRLLRLLRSLRLVKGLLPKLIDAVNMRINKQLRFGYDVGKGYITGEEEVQNYIEVMIDNKKISAQFKNLVSDGKLCIMKELGMLQRKNPGIAVSIKTQQAARRVLNSLRDKITSLRGEGMLDEGESEKLEKMVEIRMKKLMKIPATIQPPPPEKIIGNLSWVSGDTQLIEYITHNAALVSMQEGEELYAEKDPKGGIYVVISGLVKVDKYVEDNVLEDDAMKRLMRSGISQTKLQTLVARKKSTTSTEKVTDYLSTGAVLGEMSLLTGKPSNVNVNCDTSVQLYHISYDAIQAAIELFTLEPSLEYRLWKVCASRIAIGILRKQLFYRSWSQERIKLHLEKSILYLKKWEFPDGGQHAEVTSFDITSMYMSDIILIHGVCENAGTGDLFVGPCSVPNKVEHLLLLPGKTDTHIILIVPRDSGSVSHGGIRDVETTNKLQLIGAQESHANINAIHNMQEQNRFTESLFHHNTNKNAADYPIQDTPAPLEQAFPLSSLCLHHAAIRRATLEQAAEEVKASQKSHGSLKHTMSNLLHIGQPTMTSTHKAEQSETERASFHDLDLDEVVTDVIRRDDAHNMPRVLPPLVDPPVPQQVTEETLPDLDIGSAAHANINAPTAPAADDNVPRPWFDIPEPETTSEKLPPVENPDPSV